MTINAGHDARFGQVCRLTGTFGSRRSLDELLHHTPGSRTEMTPAIVQPFLVNENHLVFGLKLPEHSAQKSTASQITQRTALRARVSRPWDSVASRLDSDILRVNQQTHNKKKVRIATSSAPRPEVPKLSYSPPEHECMKRSWHDVLQSAAAFIALFRVRQILFAPQLHGDPVPFGHKK